MVDLGGLLVDPDTPPQAGEVSRAGPVCGSASLHVLFHRRLCERTVKPDLPACCVLGFDRKVAAERGGCVCACDVRVSACTSERVDGRSVRMSTSLQVDIVQFSY